MNIDLIDETNAISNSSLDILKKLLTYCAKQEALPKNSELSVVLVHDERIKELNHQYRGINKETDVLSFPLQNGVDFTLKNHELPIHLGDIIISVDRAEEQATIYGHSFKRELGFLAVHGFLHLLGYDHNSHGEEQIMFQRQKEYLKEFGLERKEIP